MYFVIFINLKAKIKLERIEMSDEVSNKLTDILAELQMLKEYIKHLDKNTRDLVTLLNNIYMYIQAKDMGAIP